VALRRLGGSTQDVLPLEAAVHQLADEATPPDLRS
jgi:threonyl-tRNA synthetase